MNIKNVRHPYVEINPGPPQDDRKNGENPDADTPARRTLDPKLNKKQGEKSKVQNVAEEKMSYRAAMQHIARQQYIPEEKVTTDSFKPILHDFVEFAIEELGIKSTPKIILKSTEDYSKQAISFASFNTESTNTTVSITNRHPMDVLRSVAHELVHHKQYEDGRLEEGSGETGSDIENEANAQAGVLMRKYGKKNPELFEKEAIKKLFDGKTGPRKLFDKDAKKEHDKNAKRKFALATTGGNDDEYLEESVKLDETKHVVVITHKGTKYHKHFNSDAEHDKWLAKALRSGKKIINMDETIALMGKASKYNIEYDILLEVFKRGLYDWIEDDSINEKFTSGQYAFNRVNSFISNGEARMLDRDLLGEAKEYKVTKNTSNKSLAKLAKRKDKVGVQARNEIKRRAKQAPPKISSVLSKMTDRLAKGRAMSPDLISHVKRASGKSLTAVVNKAQREREKQRLINKGKREEARKASEREQLLKKKHRKDKRNAKKKAIADTKQKLMAKYNKKKTFTKKLIADPQKTTATIPEPTMVNPPVVPSEKMNIISKFFKRRADNKAAKVANVEKKAKEVAIANKQKDDALEAHRFNFNKARTDYKAGDINKETLWNLLVKHKEGRPQYHDISIVYAELTRKYPGKK